MIIKKLKVLLQIGNNEIHMWHIGGKNLKKNSQELRLDTDLLCMADCSDSLTCPTTGLFFVGCKNGALKLMFIKEYKFDNIIKENTEAHKKAITCLMFQSKAHRLITGSSDMTLKVWNFKPTEISLNLQCKLMGHSANVTCLAEQDSRYIFSGAVDNTIIMWDLVQEARVKSYIGHSDFITSVHYDCKNGWLYSSCAKGVFYVWDTKKQSLEDSKIINNKGWISCFSYDEKNEILILPVGREKIAVYDFLEEVAETCIELGDQHICSILKNDDDIFTASFDGVLSLLALGVN